MVRRVARAGGEVKEKGNIRRGRSHLTQVLDGVIGKVLAQVIALVGSVGRDHRMVVLEEGRHELVRLPSVEAVPPLEPAPARPGVAPRRLMRFVVGRQVPFADGDRDVPASRPGSPRRSRCPGG